MRADFSVDCDSSFHHIAVFYAIGMAAVYPFGIPAVYAYLLFYKHGGELRLLRSLELKRVNIEQQIRFDREFVAAINDVGKLSVCAEDATATAHSSCESGGGGTRAIQMRRRVMSSRKDLVAGMQTTRTRMSSIAGVKSKGLFENEELVPAELGKQMATLKADESRLRAALPDMVQKLIEGYELRVYYFEILEALRKLAIVCAPVFFQPSGSVSQLTFGLIICFLTFGTFMVRSTVEP